MDFIYCVLYLSALSLFSFIGGSFLPRSFFREDSFPFSLFKFENNGKFYDEFGIRHWKGQLPDMSRIVPGLIPLKKLGIDKNDSMESLVKETCVAETVHYFLCISGFLCIKIWKGMGGFFVSVLYLLGNIPFIMIQRYNRPRLEELLKKRKSEGAKRKREIFADI